MTSANSEAKGGPRLTARWALPLNELALVLAIALVFVLTGLIDRNHTYFTNFESSAVIILRNTVILGIIALGAAVVIIAGGIDLSVGSMMAFSATTCALVMALFAEPSDKMLMRVGTLGIVCGVGAGILSGFLVGTLHTWLITSIRLPPFVLRWPRSSASAALPALCANS
jgi:ribose/xylose/arabinose/galactoside ABC-type transport system permease subunit